VHSDSYVVYALDETAIAGRIQANEQAVATCPSHEEAARVRQELHNAGRRCVIRCVSETGGGD
jgi:hypothetical protein